MRSGVLRPERLRHLCSLCIAFRFTYVARREFSNTRRLGLAGVTLTSIEGRDLHQVALEPLVKCLAFEQLHRDERRIGADIVDGADIGVVERGGRPCFPLETFPSQRRRGDPVRQNFDCHHPFERVSFARYTSPIPPASSGLMIL
jgi:hypothetical protein